MPDRRRDKEDKFIEEVGVVFGETGLPRMAGRIFGRLLISDPPYQSADELSKALRASKGSISTITRLLIQLSLIERLGIPGERHDHFRIKDNAWRNLIRRGLEDEIKMFHRLAEHGLELLPGKTHPTRKWLERVRDMYAFFEQEWPSLIERWERMHEEDNLASD